MTIVERIVSLLRERKIKQKDFCLSIGIYPTSLTDWKTHNTVPPVDIALRIARALGVTVEYLVTGEEGEGLTADAVRLAQKIEVLSLDQRQAVETTVDAFIKAAEALEEANNLDGYNVG